jgi:translocation and assembly module TamB
MAELTGTASAPAAEGKVDLRDGSVAMKSLGLELDRLALAAEFDEKQFILHSASGRTAKGHLSAKGALPLSGDSAAGVELEGEVTGLEFRTPEAMRFAGDAKLALRGTMKRPVLKGHLLVREGSIPVPEKRDKEVIKIPADDPWLKGSAVAGRQSPIGAKLPVDLDLTVDIPRNLWLRNREVNVEIGGDLQLTSPEGALRVTGDLETRQGSVRMLNRRFSVLKGTVSFYGEQTLKPMIDLRAETVVQSTTVQIHLTGPIEEPKLEFSSEPSYSEGDIVSLLLFGRTASELTSGEATFVQDQVGTMASSYVSSRLEAEVGQKLGLDVLEIETGSGHERVAVGKYVSSRTLLRAYQEMGTESYGGVAVEHALTKEFDLEASADDRGQSGIDLMWKRGE